MDLYLLGKTYTGETTLLLLLALLSQYACGHMGFLTVRIVGNMGSIEDLAPTHPFKK